MHVGIIFDDQGNIFDWQWWLLARLAADNRFRLAARVLPTVSGRAPHPTIALNLLLKLDAAMFARSPAFDACLVKALVTDLPVINPGTTNSNGSQTSEHPGLDVILRLGTNHLAGNDLSISRFGEWHVGFDRTCCPFPGFSAVDAVHDSVESVKLSVMARSADHDEPVAISVADYSPKFSAARTASFLGEKAAVQLLKSLTDLTAMRALPVAGDEEEVAVHPGPEGGSGPAAAYAWRLARNVGHRVSQTLHVKMGQDMAYWHLAVGSGSPDNLDVAAANDLARTGFNMADPF
ncbi:MAG: hypothetical protein ACK5JT_07210, partial [Hyphomicrobiaceae bacterium]